MDSMEHSIRQEHLTPVAELDVTSRSRFIARTYLHLLGAILLFVLLEVVLFTTGAAEGLLRIVVNTNWLLFLGAFMLIGWLASRTAHNSASRGMQYAALLGYVLAEALIFAPLLYIADAYADGGVITSAALVTTIAFAALTAVVFITRKDFSFLGGLLKWLGILALALIIAGIVFGFQLGTFFSVLMVGFAGAAVLYTTSNIIERYPEDRYIGAPLELFASIALMFWYILRLFMRD